MRSFKKIASILMLASFIFATVSPAMAAGLKKITDIAGGNGGNALGNASTIYFGNYWQSAAQGYTPVGYFAEPEDFNANHYNKGGIKWRVLANDQTGTGTKQIFLLSDQTLYAAQFNEYDEETGMYGRDKNISEADAGKWETSDIRKTLNNTTATTFNEDGSVNAWGGFAGDAFGAEEYAAIAETTHTAGGEYSGKDIETTDKLFILSYEEANNINYGFENTGLYTESDTRKAPAAEMAQHTAVYGDYEGNFVEGGAVWRLRSPAYTGCSYAVAYDGSIDENIEIHYGYAGALPAFCLKQESVLFLSAAESGKEDVKPGDGFALADYDGSQGWKLTLKDENIPAPKITNVETKDSKLLITYSSVQTGGNMYLSALLYNEAGELVNYAKIADAAETGEGTAEISLDNLDTGKYKVRFFAEQANGGKQTDYASALSEEYEITAEKPKSSSGGGGCNAGFGALAMLALAGLAYRKNNKQ